MISQTSWLGHEEGIGTLLLILKPQQYKILPLCGFTILLSALKAVFSKGISFKIVCERRAAGSCAGVLHFFFLAAVSAQGGEGQATALGRRSIDVCKACSNERWWGKKASKP